MWRRVARSRPRRCSSYQASWVRIDQMSIVCDPANAVWKQPKGFDSGSSAVTYPQLLPAFTPMNPKTQRMYPIRREWVLLLWFIGSPHIVVKAQETFASFVPYSTTPGRRQIEWEDWQGAEGDLLRPQ